MEDILAGLSEEEKTEIIRFGIARVKVLLLSAVVVLLLGKVFNVFGESITFLLSIYFLRIYAGGYHAKTQGRCLVLSLIIVSIGLGSIKYLSDWNNGILFFYILVAGTIIWKFAPVENQNKLLDEMEKKEYAKKTKIVLACQFCIIVTAYCFHNTEIFTGIVIAMVTVALGMISGKVQNVYIEKKKNNQNIT